MMIILDTENTTTEIKYQPNSTFICYCVDDKNKVVGQGVRWRWATPEEAKYEVLRLTERIYTINEDIFDLYYNKNRNEDKQEVIEREFLKKVRENFKWVTK